MIIGEIGYLGVDVRPDLGFMNCMILALRAFSVSSSSGSNAAAFRLRDTGTMGVEALSTWLAMRVRWGSGSRHNGAEVAS